MQAGDRYGSVLTAGLKSAFAKLGITPDMIDKFKPVLLETAGKLGGASVGVQPTPSMANMFCGQAEQAIMRSRRRRCRRK